MAIDKGCTSGDLIAAGEKVLRRRPRALLLPDAGAGRARGRRRARRGLRPRDPRGGAAAPAGNPLVVRLRTAAVVPSTPLGAREAAGEFVLPDDVEVAQELRDLLEQLGDARLELRSDHMLNLLHGARGLAAARPRAAHRAARRVPGLAARRPGAVRRRRAARPLPAPRRLRRPGAPARPRPAVRRVRASRAPTSCCRRRRRSARATSEARRRPSPARPLAGGRRPVADVARQVPLHGRPDGRHELVHRRRGQRLDVADVAHHREADELRARRASRAAARRARRAPAVIGPKTSRTRRSRIMPMAASLVIAERSMAMRRTRRLRRLPGLEEGADDRRAQLRRVPPPCRGRRPRPAATGSCERLGEQRLLGAEVVDDERRVDRRARGDAADGRAVVAELGERRARGRQDRLARGALARAAAARRPPPGLRPPARRPEPRPVAASALIRPSSARRPRRPRRGRRPPGARRASSPRGPRARPAAAR